MILPQRLYGAFQSSEFAPHSDRVFVCHRYSAEKSCTLGMLSIAGRFLGFTMEPIWGDGRGGKGLCIAEGIYRMAPDHEGNLPRKYDRKFKDIWHEGMAAIVGVPGRTEINAHIGNFPRHTLGCPLVGLGVLVGGVPSARLSSSTKCYRERFYPAWRELKPNDPDSPPIGWAVFDGWV